MKRQNKFKSKSLKKQNNPQSLMLKIRRLRQENNRLKRKVLNLSKRQSPLTPEALTELKENTGTGFLMFRKNYFYDFFAFPFYWDFVADDLPHYLNTILDYIHILTKKCGEREELTGIKNLTSLLLEKSAKAFEERKQVFTQQDQQTQKN